MKRQALIVALLMLACPFLAQASFRGDLERWGIASDGTNVTITGNLDVIGSTALFGDSTGASGEYTDNDTDSFWKIIFNDDTATPINLYLYTSNASPGDNDTAKILLGGLNTSSTATIFTGLYSKWTDVDGGTEDAEWQLWGMKAGTLTQFWTFDGTCLYPGADDTYSIGKAGAEIDDLNVDGTANIDALVADTADIDGGTAEVILGGTTPKAASVTTLGVSGALTLGTGVTLPTATAVSLTSPTVTFSAASKFRIILTSDANLTGVYPTGGSLNQVIQIESGAGSNTMRFDDGTSLPLGGNVTLTEAQGDVLTLVCTSADGDEWKALSAHDN